MSKVLLLKNLLLFTFFINVVNLAFSQGSLSLRGQLIVDKKIVVGSVVTVYDGNDIVTQTATDKLGKFWIELLSQKTYVVQFKTKILPIQKVIISTKSDNQSGDFLKSKVVIFNLSSANYSKEGPDSNDAVATFSVNDKGMMVREQVAVIEPVRFKDPGEENIDVKIKQLERESDSIITNLPDLEKENQIAEYKLLIRKKDSIIYWAEVEAELILKAAQVESENIVEVSKKNKNKASSTKKGISRTNSEIKEDLKNLSIEEKAFFEREDVKKFQRTIEKYSAQEKLSKKDSIEYFNTVVLFNEEMIKSARLQLEVDKLNAKTKDDSLLIQQRETEIFYAEQEIKEAQNQIAIQKLEIKQKNTMLMFSISALLFFVILSLMVYKSFMDKKRTNLILEKQNAEIANKNKKIIDSIRYAQTIQQAILPIKTYIDKYFEWFLIFQPKDIVSGDFYWFNHFEEKKKSIFAVVDCTGHGVPGAFMSMIGNRLLIEAVKEKEIDSPVQILEAIDANIRVALMQDETSNNDGMDICVCTIEYIKKNKCRIVYAGAKRPLFFSNSKNGKMEYIKGTVRGIGGKKRLREKAKKQFSEHTIEIDKGEMLYLTTDGFFDLQSPNRKKFGRVNFMELLDQHFQKPMPEQKEAIMEALHLHKGSEFQIDDITILGIKL